MNRKFHEHFIDSGQFALTPLVPAMFRYRDVPLLLYDYPEGSSAAAGHAHHHHRGAFALTPQGSLQLHAAQRAAHRSTDTGSGTGVSRQGAAGQETEAITHGWKVQQPAGLLSTTPERSESDEKADKKWHWSWKKQK